MYPIAIPPLRERGEDVLLLAGHFLDLAQVRLGLGQIRLSQAARQRLVAFDWPGNVRELEHTMLRAALRAAAGRRREDVVIDAEHLGIEPLPHTESETAVTVQDALSPPPHGSLTGAVDAFRKRMIQDAVRHTQGKCRAQAARQLGIDRGNLHRLAQRLGIRAAKSTL